LRVRKTNVDTKLKNTGSPVSERQLLCSSFLTFQEL
jgi:hypothetical protein